MCVITRFHLPKISFYIKKEGKSHDDDIAKKISQSDGLTFLIVSEINEEKNVR